MKNKWLLILLSLVLVVSLAGFAACAGEEVPTDVAELEGKIDELEADNKALEKDKAALEAEMEGLIASPEVIKWKLQTIGTEGGYAYECYGPIFCDKVRRASDGRLDITPWPSGAVIPSSEILAAVGDGTIEMGATCGHYTGGTIPVMNLHIGIPNTYTSLGDLALLWYYYQDRGLFRIQQAAYREHNVHYLGNWGDTSMGLLLREPITSLDDLKGLNIAAIGGSTMYVLEKAGASASYMPSTEIYTSLATGLVDGVSYCNLGIMMDLSFDEHAKYYLLPELTPLGMGNDLLINLDAWNSLPDDLQAILGDVMDSMFAEGLWTQAFGKSIDYTPEFLAAGGQFFNLPDEDWETIQGWSVEFLDEIAAKDPKYAAPAVQLLKEFLIWKADYQF